MVIEIKKNKTPQDIANEKLEKTKMETSKKIILASYIITIILTILVIIGTFMQINVSHLTTIAALAWGEVAVSNAAYYRKAAKENVPKVIASLPQFFQEKVDVNQLLKQD